MPEPLPQPIPRSTLLADPAEYEKGVPHYEFARRRREAPVYWVEEMPLWLHDSTAGMASKGTGFWAITRHSDVESVSRQPDVFSSAARGAFLADPKSRQDLERTRQLLINMNAPQHTELRRFVTAAFTPRAVRQMQQSIQMHAVSIVNKVLEMGEFDTVRDIAAELPLLVLADLLGMPREDRSLMFKWSNSLVGFDDPEYGGGSVKAYESAFAEAFEYALRLAAAKRRQPTADLVSTLVTCEVDGRRLTESEFCHLWMLLVVGGNESTRHLLSGSIQALIEWPRELDRLADDADLVPPAIEELLRWVSPIMQFRRTATRDIELDRQTIHEGDKVVLYYTSANRDEEIFEFPDKLDLGRTPNPHLAFGVGPHFCLGAHLARVEAATLLTVLRPHLRKLELSGPVVRLRSNFMNGIKSMPIRVLP